MQSLSKNFINIVIAILLVIILIETCKRPEGSVEQPKVVRDTTWVIKDSTIHSKPTVIIRENADSTIIKQYLPDTNYAKLLAQYNTLVNNYLGRTIQQDSLKIDTIGYVTIRDTIQTNTIVGRDFTYNLRYPTIKETIITPAKKVNQFYIGGSLEGTKLGLTSINAGLLYKSKRDQILGGSVGLTSDGQFQVGLQSYWKIKFK